MISKQTRTAIFYIASILIIVIGTIILVALARGYSYDFFNGQIKENGLVIVNSIPSGASISFNGNVTKYKTPYRLVNAEPGSLTVSLKKAEFRDWQKKLIVQAQEVSFADRALLIPQTIFYENLYGSFRVAASLQSNDNRKVVFVTDKPTLSIWMSEGEKAPVKIYQVPTPDKPEETITSISDLQLSPNNGSQLLFKVTSQARSNYLTLPTIENQIPININNTFGINSGNLTFNPTNNHEFYWLDSGLVRKINLDSKNTGDILVDNIIYIKVDSDRIFYISAATPNNLSRELWGMDLNGVRKIKILNSVVDSPDYQIDYTRVNQKDYLVLLASKDKTATLYSDIYNQLQSSVLSKDAVGFTFSPNGTYLVVNNNNSTKSFDLDLVKHYNFKTDLAGLSDWRWLDDYHLLIITNGKLRIMDFDGQNDQLISASGDIVSNVLPNNDIKSINYVSSGQVKKLHLTLMKK